MSGRVALAWALAALYLPTLVPFAVGPLPECGHCVRTYVRLPSLFPGAPLGFLAGRFRPSPDSDGVFGLAAAVAAVALLAACTELAHRLGQRAFFVLAPAVAAVGATALGFSYTLRA